VTNLATYLRKLALKYRKRHKTWKQTLPGDEYGPYVKENQKIIEKALKKMPKEFDFKRFVAELQKMSKTIEFPRTPLTVRPGGPHKLVPMGGWTMLDHPERIRNRLLRLVKAGKLEAEKKGARWLFTKVGSKTGETNMSELSNKLRKVAEQVREGQRGRGV